MFLADEAIETQKNKEYYIIEITQKKFFFFFHKFSFSNLNHLKNNLAQSSEK